MGALVVLAAEAGSITPGGTGECVVLIRNEAETHDDFDVLVHGPAAVWATVDPPIASVPPGEEVPVWVRFAIPRERAIPPGPIDFVVTVASKSDPDFIHAERGAITIGGFAVLAAALDEPHGEGKTFLVPVTLTNEGNATIEANVGVRDSYEPPLKVQVAPGGSTSLDVEVPRRPGLEKVTIDITAAGAPALAFTAPVPDQHRTLRRDLVRSAMVFGGLLLAAFIVVATLGRDNEPETTKSLVTAPGSTSVPSDAEQTPTTAEDPLVETADTVANASNTPSSDGRPGLPGPAPPDLPTLVYVRWYGPGDRDLVVREAGAAAGFGELRLRSPGTVESAPALSPDGSKIAFIREQGGEWRTCVSSVGGGDATCLLTVGPTADVGWRPDGAAVYTTRGSELLEITVDGAGAPTAEPVVLPVSVPGGRFSLSPDGTQIAFVEDRRIVIRSIAGGDGMSLTVPGAPEDPTWTSDGARIVYTADTQIHSAPLGDGPINQLTTPSTVNGDPVVAGPWVVFRSNRSGNGDLYAVRLETRPKAESGLSLVTRAPERDTDPAR